MRWFTQGSDGRVYYPDLGFPVTPDQYERIQVNAAIAKYLVREATQIDLPALASSFLSSAPRLRANANKPNAPSEKVIPVPAGVQT